MSLIKPLFFGGLLPAIVGGGLFIIARSVSATADREKREDGFSGWLIAAALGVGYIIGYLGLEKFLPFPPKLGIHWLCYLAIIGVIVAGLWRFAPWGRLMVRVGLAVIVPRLLLTSTFKYTWGPTEGIIWWGCLAVAIFIFWRLVEGSFSALPSGTSVPFVYFGLSGGTALILAFSGSLRLAQHCGIFVAIFAAIWILTLVLQGNNNPFVFPLGASPVVTLLFVGIWMNGYFFADVPAVSSLLLAISPLFAQIQRIAAVRELGGRRFTFVQIAAIALPVVVAVVIAVVRSGFFGESSEY